MTFVFVQPTDCNLYLIHEFFANWDPKDLYPELKVLGKVIKLTTKVINHLLGVLEENEEQLR